MWLTIPQLAKATGIREGRLKAYIKDGMRYYQETPGGRITARVRDVEDYMERFAHKAENEMPEALKFLMEMR